MFSYEIYELLIKNFFYRAPPVAASEGFTNSCYKIVSPVLLQELINDFAVCKHYSGTLLLVEDITSTQGFGN